MPASGAVITVLSSTTRTPLRTSVTEFRSGSSRARSIDGLAAVDHDRGAVDVGGGVRDQERGDVADLLALRKPLQHDLLHDWLGIGFTAVEVSFDPATAWVRDTASSRASPSPHSQRRAAA